MGEVATAKFNNVHVVKVILPDFQWPAAEFFQNYEAHVSEVSLLSQHGLAAGDVKAAIMWMQERRSLRLQFGMDASLMKNLVDLLVKSAHLQADREVSAHASNSPIASPKPPCSETKTVICADTSNLEARCTAMVLVRLLTRMMQNTPAEIPLVMEEGEGLAPTLNFQQLCLICTNGVFRSALVWRVLLQAAEKHSVAVLPVVSEPSFRFPTKVSLEELDRESAVVLTTMGSQYSGQAVVKLVERIFTEIAVEINPQDAEDILSVRAQTLAARLRSGLRPLGLSLDGCKDNVGQDHAEDSGMADTYCLVEHDLCLRASEGAAGFVPL